MTLTQRAEPTRLRRALLANACFSAASGLGLTLAREPLARWLGVGDPATLAWTGLVLLAFAGHLVWASGRRMRAFEACYFVASDAFWVAGTAVLVLAFPGHLSLAGRWTAMAVAVVVGGLVAAQLMGFRQARQPST